MKTTEEITMTKAARKTELPDIHLVEKEAARVAQAYEEVRKNREENRQRRKNGGRKPGVLSLLVKNDKSVIRIIKKEQACKRAMSSIKPKEWRKRIMHLPEPLRTKVGHIIWWDFFGARRVTKRWPHLDDILANHAILVDETSFSRDELVLALYNAGYSACEALKRINESYTDE